MSEVRTCTGIFPYNLPPSLTKKYLSVGKAVLHRQCKASQALGGNKDERRLGDRQTEEAKILVPPWASCDRSHYLTSLRLSFLTSKKSE